MPALLKRGLALTLPLCLLWLFIACLAVCSLHAEEESAAVSESPSWGYASVLTDSEDCCSVTDGERSVLPERLNYAWISPQVARAISISTDLVSHGSDFHRSDRYSPPGPNVKLLGTLRI